jgi:hypothetical protein
VRPKISLIALAVVLATGLLLWLARESPPGLRDPEATAEHAQTERDRRERDEGRKGNEGRGGNEERARGGEPVGHAEAARAAAALEKSSRHAGEALGGSAAEVDAQTARSAAQGGTAARPQRRAYRGPFAANPPRRPGADDDPAAAGESGDESGDDDFDHFKERLASLQALSKAGPPGETIDPDVAGVSAEEMDRLDLDQDRALAGWELERSRRLTQQADNHPVKNDQGDGAYPIERADYRRTAPEFDAVDSNGDDVLDVDEYYEFLLDAERTSLTLDVDGDRYVSASESGLAEGDFARFDRDDSGRLEDRELRRAIAEGALQRH